MKMAIEFRSHKDDAWYDAHLLSEYAGGEHRLRIKFATFPDEHDELINLKDLKSQKDVEALRSRVRKISVQLQDYECSKVNKGLVVCAAHSVPPDDRRYFDGVIDMVVRKEHRIVKGEEVCDCKYVVEWTSGPDVGILSSLAIGDICRVQQAGSKVPATDEELISPVLSSFLDRAKEKNESNFSNSTTISVEKVGCDSESCRTSNKRFKDNSAHKDTPARRYIASVMNRSFKAPRQESECNSKDLHQKSKQAEMVENPSERSGLDNDIEGTPYVLFVENLEKGISPVTIMQFLYQQVSVSCVAFVMPSKPSETYTRGIIILDNKMNLEKVSNFLESPDRIIVSSRGRPWIVSEKLLDDTLRATIQAFKLTSQATFEGRTSSSNELKVVVSGSREYQKANMLKKLIKEFINHQCRVHNRLLYDEAEIPKIPM